MGLAGTMRAGISVAAATLLFVAAPAKAAAESLTLGPSQLSALTPLTFTTPVCADGPCTSYQDPVRGAQGAFWSSPVNGVVTGWSIRVSATGFSDQTGAGNRFRLRVIRVAQGAPADFIAVRSSLALTPIFSAPGIYAQAVSLPISAGEQIALGATQNAELPTFLSPSVNVVRFSSPPDPPDGQLGQAFNSNNTSMLGINATVEFCRVPNVRGKKLRRASRLVSGAACAPKPKAKGKARRPAKRKRIHKQIPAAGETVPPGTPVKLVYRR